MPNGCGGRSPTRIGGWYRGLGVPIHRTLDAASMISGYRFRDVSDVDEDVIGLVRSVNGHEELRRDRFTSEQDSFFTEKSTP